MSVQKTPENRFNEPINFDEIPDQIILPLEARKYPFTVLDEINARGKLVEARTFKGKDIKPLYAPPKKPRLRYAYRDLCICPTYKPVTSACFTCHHTGKIIIDRDVLSREEHMVHLATPKPNFAPTTSGPVRGMVRYERKRYIVLNCTSRITRLATPNGIHIRDTMQRFKHILNDRHLVALNQQLEEKPEVEVTDIVSALAFVEEERRLRRVVRRAERSQCRKMEQQIASKQKSQVKKIICVLFEEMKSFLLNDHFVMDDGSTLVSIILEAIKEFTDKEFYMTSNLREYQKILAFNLAIWINKFISNLNIHVSASQPKQPLDEEAGKLGSFLPVSDYISCSTGEEEWCPDEIEEENEMEVEEGDYVTEAQGADAPTNEGDQAD